MTHLDEDNAFFQLLRWNKELPAGSDQDPLGLNLRLAARIANKLLYCITSITPRARYYSFYAWCFQDYFDNEKGTRRDRGQTQAIVQRERALVLGSVLHHDGALCDGGGLGGSEQAKKLFEQKSLSRINLAEWSHLKNREGNFAAYKGSLINLGYFDGPTNETPVPDDVETANEELSEDVQQHEISGLTSLARHLAASFAQSVAHTRYIREGWAFKQGCSTEILKEFGAAAGLCEITTRKSSREQSVLRDLFFATDPPFSTDRAHLNRRLSLTLILWLVELCEKHHLAFSDDRLESAVFYHRIPTDDEPESFIEVTFPPALQHIAALWRQLYFHYSLAIALQSLLVSVVREARGHMAGIPKSALLSQFENQAVQGEIVERLGMSLTTPFFDLTPAQILRAASIIRSECTMDAASTTFPDIASLFSERSLSYTLIADDVANEVAGPAFALILLFVLLIRYQSVSQADDRWHRDNIYEPYSDVSLPGIADALRRNFGDQWWQRSNREIFSFVVWRFVIKQHEIMSYERGFGGSPALLRIDGDTILPTDVDYVDPSISNARLPSAVQILKDLGLIQMRADEEGVLPLTTDGKAWLKNMLEKEEHNAGA